MISALVCPGGMSSFRLENPSSNSREGRDCKITLIALGVIASGIVILSLTFFSYLPSYCYTIGTAAIGLGFLIPLLIDLVKVRRDHHTREPERDIGDHLCSLSEDDVSIWSLINLFDKMFPDQNLIRDPLGEVIAKAASIYEGHDEKDVYRDCIYLRHIYLYLSDPKNSFIALRCFQQIADGDSCGPTVSEVIDEALNMTVGGAAEDQIRQMVQKAKTDMIQWHYGNWKKNPDEWEWHFIHQLTLTAADEQPEGPLVGEQFGLNMRAARRDHNNRVGEKIDLESFRRWYERYYTRELKIEFLTRDASTRIQHNKIFIDYVKDFLFSLVPSEIPDEEEKLKWLEKEGFLFLESKYLHYMGEEKKEIKREEYEQLNKEIEGRYDTGERLCINGITDKTSDLLLQRVGIL